MEMTVPEPERPKADATTGDGQRLRRRKSDDVWRRGAIVAIICWAVVSTCAVIGFGILSATSDETSNKASQAVAKAQTAIASAQSAAARANQAIVRLQTGVANGCVRNNQKIRQDDLNAEGLWAVLAAIPPGVLEDSRSLTVAKRTLSWIPTTNCAKTVSQQGSKYVFAAPVPFSKRVPTGKDLEVGSVKHP